MTLSSTPTLQDVNTEVGRAAGFAFNMNTDSYARYLAHASQTPGTNWQMSALANGKASIITMGIAVDPNSGGVTYGAVCVGGTQFGSLSPTSLVMASSIPLFGIWGQNTGSLSVNTNGTVAQSFWKYLLFTTTVAGTPFAVVDSALADGYNTFAQWTYNSVPGLNFPARNGQTIFLTFIK